MADVNTEAKQLKSERFKIDALLQLVADGRVRVPTFQRPIRWTNRDACLLFDSIYRGYPVGTLLFWLRPAPKADVQLGPVKISVSAHDEAYWVVDGQQRITALSAALLPSDPAATPNEFDVSFDLHNRTFRRARTNDPPHVVPVRVAHEPESAMSWVFDHKLEDAERSALYELTDRLRNYEIPAYLVSADEEEVLHRIFDRINTSGRKMTKADVFSALSMRSGEEKSDLAALNDSIQKLGYGRFEGNTLTYCVLATRGPDATREFRNEFRPTSGSASVDAEDQVEAMAKTLDAVKRVKGFLEQTADIPHFSLVPYQFLTVALVRFFAVFPEPDSAVVVSLRRWFWRAALQGPDIKLGPTGMLRSVGKAVDVTGGDAGSVKRLDEILLGETATQPELGAYRWNASANRMAVCALANLGPLVPQPRESTEEAVPIEVTVAIESAGREALSPVVAKSRFERSSTNDSDEFDNTIANRVFLDPDGAIGEDELLDAVLGMDQKSLTSHALTSAMVEHLKNQQWSEFWEQRSQHVAEILQAFVDARAERDLLDRPSIETLIAQ